MGGLEKAHLLSVDADGGLVSAGELRQKRFLGGLSPSPPALARSTPLRDTPACPTNHLQPAPGPRKLRSVNRARTFTVGVDIERES